MNGNVIVVGSLHYDLMVEAPDGAVRRMRTSLC